MNVIIKPIEQLVTNFDIFIGVVGFESRSSFLPEQLSSTSAIKIAIAFPHQKVLSYNENLKKLLTLGFDVEEYLETCIHPRLENSINVCLKRGSTVSIAVDVSSMTREMIAKIAYLIFQHELNTHIEITYLYAPAKFIKYTDDNGPITVAAPVIPELAGWTADPELPPSGIIGLGYEYDRALGIMEQLEVSPVWFFVPRGEDAKYDAANDKANADLYDIVPRSCFIPYQVDNPAQCFYDLESLIHGIKHMSRPIIVPFGPKIFSLVAVLVGLAHFGEVAVWRVSGDKFTNPIDRIASGKIVSILATIGNVGTQGEPS